MRLIGPRIYMALEPMPRYKLMWHREPLRVRAMGWLSWIRWREPSERATKIGSVVAIVCALGLSLGYVLWERYGN